MLARFRRVLIIVIPLMSVALILSIWLGPWDHRLALSLVAVLGLAVILGVLGLCLIHSQRSTAAALRSEAASLKVNTAILELVEIVNGLGTSMKSQLDANEQAARANFERIDKRLGRHGRRIERTYQGLERYLGPAEPAGEVIPLPARLTAANEILDRTNAKLDSLRAEVDQSSKRLREHSAQLRLILEEHAKISSHEVLVAKAAVIEELLEGMDLIISQSAERELL